MVTPDQPIGVLADLHAQCFPDETLESPPPHPATGQRFTHFRDYLAEQINTPIRSCPTAVIGGRVFQVGPERIVGVVDGPVEVSVTFVNALGTADARLAKDGWHIVAWEFDSARA